MEQRSRPRVPCTLSVQVHAPTEDVLLFTYATDVSASGVFVRAKRPLPIGTRVHLELHQTRSERVAVDGVVVHTPDHGPRGMGLVFVEVDESARSRLGRLLDRAGMQNTLTHADADADADAAALVHHQQK